MSIEALSGKVFLVITGASRGIGRQIAISFGKALHANSHVLLLATNQNALLETAKQLPANLSVDTVSVDLSKATKTELNEIVMKSLKGKAPEEFDRLVVVHNVGTIGDITQSANDMTNVDEWRNYFDLNVFIPAILNGIIMNIFNEKTNTKKVVVNITSLFAVQPGKATGYYSSGKAAREAFFKVFALENPEVSTLNYSPGPVETDMFHTVCDEIKDEDAKKQFNEMRVKKTVLTAEQTVNRLLAVLREKKYNSGDHVDYFDEL